MESGGDFSIKEGTSTRLTFQAGGNVGIGTTSPQQPFQVDAGSNIASFRSVGTGENNKELLIQTGGDRVTLDAKNADDGTATSLAFELGNSEKARLTPTGLGIGTTSPAGLLHVSSGTSGDALVIIESDTDNNNENDNPTLKFAQDGGNTIAKVGLNGDAGTVFTNSLANTAYFGNNEAASVQLYTNATARLTIESGGDVGIGTTNPSFKLDVTGDGIRNVRSTAGWAGWFENTNNSSGVIVTAGVDSGDAPLLIRKQDGTELFSVRGNGTSWFNNGNVGVGTTSPQSKLHIETGSGGTYNPNVNHDDVTIEGSGNIGLQLFSPATSYQYIAFGDPGSVNAGYLRYYHGTNEMVFRTNGSDNMVINSAGNVGIGTTSPATQLEIYNSNDQPATLRLSSTVSDGDAVAAIISFSNDAGGGGVQGRIENIATEDDTTVFKFYTDNTSSPSMSLFDSGNMTIAGTLTQNSDVRLKENIKPIESALDKIKQMQGVEFNKINSGTKEIGVVAQEIEKIIPELVLEDKEGIKSVAYGNITAVLIEAIKEQQKQIEELKQQLNK
jgi:hypothetical protein